MGTIPLVNNNKYFLFFAGFPVPPPGRLRNTNNIKKKNKKI
jgi:hypothetical protein